MAEPKATAKQPFLPRHGAFYVGLAAGIVAFLVGLWFYPPYAFAVGVNALFVVYLMLISFKFRSLTPEMLRKHADDSDTPTWVILGVVVAVVGVSAFELFAALNAENYTGFCFAEIPASTDPVRLMKYYRSLWLAYQNLL